LCSLSHARNIGLRHAKFDVVAFPDDDCWYPAGLLSYVRNQLEGSSLDGLCLGIFDPYRSRPYGKRPLNVRVPLKPSNAFYLPISVGLFIRSRVLATGAPDGFDERLGAGTRWGAGEETDLVCQLLDNNVPMEYDSRATVYHETASYSRNDVPKYLSYGRGFGAALGKRVARGDLHPFLTLLDIAARSALGALVNLLRFRFVPCGVYLNRGAGMIQGFIEALRHYRMSREQTRC
jgi:glycosyltransferase involved in cell wall biosynthesis